MRRGVERADPKRRMTKGQSEAEAATKFVAEVAHARGRYGAMVRFKRLTSSQGHSSGGALLLTGRRAREIPYARCSTDLMAGNTRHLWAF